METFDDYFWSMSNAGVRIGEEGEGMSYMKSDEGQFTERGGVYTIFDTGAPDMYISSLWFNTFLDSLFANTGNNYRIEDGTVFASCDGAYDNVYFNVEGYWLQIPREDYLVDISEDGTGRNCKLRFRSIDAPFNIMGIPAFLGYYVTHDFKAGTMSFAPHRDSIKP